MGHYRSGDGYEEEDLKEAERRKKEQLKRATNYIEQEIEKKGIAQVLAEIVLDKHYRIKVL